MIATLPLFPDLLEDADHFGRNSNYKREGHGIWSFEGGMTLRYRTSDCSEQRHLLVVYDDERWLFKRDRTGLRWKVELRHYFNSYIGKKREVSQRVRTTTRAFATREEAVALAEKLLAVFRMVRSPGPQKEEPMLVSVQFRGEERDVEIDRDHGYEDDTGAHEIDWHFYGMTPEQHAALEMTTEEEEAIFLQLQGVSDQEW